MADPADRSDVDADRVVERDETYEHEQYGTVEVTGIWKGVSELDATYDADEQDVYIVRYTADEDGNRVDELTDTLSVFLVSLV
ncbi:hypothetical protein [Natronolimnohabitans innermongolicus]|uniref:Uncharacterized protein n=1 Tax=Natronolimnohabitans innermongolicus JCM 12255 TaxID=1227499 RepID=L9WY68_9EURY|nr:hypothetical protein [Natronolimnohabitans innermongolicus]ELY53308.1 hypothetical protein C493_14798 [Natronolimnohabitans innermongolicus JCM 12255]